MALTKITTSIVAVNSLTAANIADNSIDATKIANNQILARHIAAGALSDAVAGISSAADATAITIDSSENVGIGATSPLTDLDVARGGTTGLSSVNARTTALFQNNNSAGTTISINAPNTGYSGIFLGDPENEAQGQIQQVHTTNAMQFTSSGGAAEMILKAGNVGIGTDPSFRLHVLDTIGTRTLSLGHGVSTGTITTDSAKDLNFQQAGTTKMTFDDAGKLGIGTTDPASILHLYGVENGEGTAKGQLRIQSSTAFGSSPQAGIVFTNEHTSGSQAMMGGIRVGKLNTTDTNYSGFMAFDVRNHGAVAFEAMRIDNTGNVGIGTADNLERTLTVSTGLAKTSTSTATPFAIQTGDANTNGRFSVHYIGGASAADRKVFLQMEEDGVANAGQLHFNYYGGTVHSPQGMIFGTETTAAHTLDDYEEGSWTIGISSSDPGSMSTTLSNSYGWFVKVGKLVTLGGSFDLSTSSPQGTMRITGLPFACSSNGTRPLFVGVVGYTINVVPQPHLVTLGNGSSESYLDVWKQGNNTRYNVSDFNNGGRMNFQISYETA